MIRINNHLHSWRQLSLGEQVECLEVEGYVVLPDMLDLGIATELRSTLDQLPLSQTNYSDRQWYVHDVQWLKCAQGIKIITYKPIIDFLRDVFGDEVQCVSCTYARTDPGYPGMALHTDSQPYGSNIFGHKASSPIMLRVLYYLDDLNDDCAPLRVVPCSHLSLHHDANPYQRYRSHPEETVVTCNAGDAIIINQRLFHAVGANTSSRSRAVYAISYRPSWAGPIADVQEHTSKQLQELPQEARRLFENPNARIDTEILNWSENLPTVAKGLAPSRWRQEIEPQRGGK